MAERKPKTNTRKGFVMKCFTCMGTPSKARRAAYTLPGNAPPEVWHRGIAVEQSYLRIGDVVIERPCLWVGEVIVDVSEELLRDEESCDTSCAGKKVILKASIAWRDRQPVLVREKEDDAGDALVMLKLGPNGSKRLEYQVNGAQVIESGVKDHGLGYDLCPQMLVRLKPDESVLAMWTSPKWLFWGPYVADKVVLIHFGPAITITRS